MRVLVFDTETTGLPKTKMINPDSLHLWPHIVQFSYLIYDTESNDIMHISDQIVKVTSNVDITEESIQFHGITNEMSQSKGVKIYDILYYFFNYLKNVDVIVGHNVSFDINMVKVELLRIIYLNMYKDETEICKYNLHFLTNSSNICCTLQDSVSLCNIQALTKYGKPYLKFPKLIELHQKLFNGTPNHLHNSLNDILVTLRCYMMLKHGIDINEKCNKFKSIAASNGLL
jgi:DNA polymerase III epsilon subunit-like protein